MKRFYLWAFIAFAALKTTSVLAHYLSPSPWGGPLVLRPDRLVPDALLIEYGLLGLLVLATSIPELRLSDRLRPWWRAVVVFVLALYAGLGQLDLEVVRWLGQHINLSYIRNFSGASDPHMVQRIVSGDPWWTGFSALLLLAGFPLALGLWARGRADSAHLKRRTIIALTVFTLLAATSPTWFRPSEKRWRRVRPGVLVLLHEAYLETTGLERPRQPGLARNDLLDLVTTGHIGTATVDETQPVALAGATPEFPLWRDTNVGEIPVTEFASLPMEQRPDVIVIVFETMRGWNTGHAPHPELEAGTPEVNQFLQGRSLIFPYMHSSGFPSVEGCMGIHLGIWAHFRKIIFSDFLHIRTRGFPEILADAGYHTRALLGADPSFSNFTPWMERWYEQFEYIPGVHHDGPLVDRFIEIHTETREVNQPRYLMLWTATTHPPYDVPASEGTLPADDSEARFDQAIRYADRQVARLLQHLARQPEWNRTIVLILGDHAQPTPDQWRLEDRVGPLTPGHTWTNFIVTGGWPGIPAPTVYAGDTSHIDVAPTILGLLNLRAPNHFMGRNLLPLLQQPDTQWPVLSFRYGDIAWQQGDTRLNFRVDTDNLMRWDVDRSDTLSYGLLRPESVTPQQEAPPEWQFGRIQDAVRSYARLLEENALMPPQP
jgi:hypothetical protein